PAAAPGRSYRAGAPSAPRSSRGFRPDRASGSIPGRGKCAGPAWGLLWILRDGPAVTAVLAKAGLQPLQPLDRRIQRRLVLREAKPRESLPRRRHCVERRQRNRRDAVFGRQPSAERKIVEVADGRIVD